MRTGLTGSREAETRMSTGAMDTSVPRSEVPCLTILAHPEAGRVGERLELPALAAGSAIPLSRLTPTFPAVINAGDRPRRRPLEEHHLSRRPIRLIPGEEAGSVALERASSRTRVLADGQPLEERFDFSAAKVGRGVVLELGTRVVLLLHRAIPRVHEELPAFGLVGDSDAIVRLRRAIARLAGLDVPVLLRGATGTGKELVANALHQAGPRGRGPWMAVNMGAMTPSLAAAELFGAVRGAYTGADRRKAGVFESAAGGTLFLDEIGETPAEVQAALLRVLESGEIRPVGSNVTRRVDVRVIAATDADLEAAIADGRFRAPLLHRLAGYSLRLPELAARRDDVGRLLVHFLAEESEKLGAASSGGQTSSWPPAALVARLARHDWPGNVRELRNVARRMAILGPGAAPEELAGEIDELLGESRASGPAPAEVVASAPDSVAPDSAAPDSAAPDTSVPPSPRRRRRLRKPEEVSDEELIAVLRAQRYNLRATASALGLSPVNLYRRMDDCPAVRKASDLGREEIEAALESWNGDLEAAATGLEVSLQGLKRRLTALGLKRS